jgi:hypothetical protein
LVIELTSRTNRRAGALLALTTVALAGCGGSGTSGNGVASKTPTQIIAAAKSASADAKSVHISGSIVSGGKPISLDMKLVSGKGGKGQIVLEGLSIRLIDVGQAVYMNGSTAFYQHIAGATAAQLLQGKWLKVPASNSGFASLASLTDLGKLISTTLASHGKLASVGSTTIDGQKAIGVSDATKAGTLYVATTGIPFPLEVIKHGAGGGKIVFDEWNKPVTLTAPSDSVDIDKLQAAAR